MKRISLLAAALLGATFMMAAPKATESTIKASDSRITYIGRTEVKGGDVSFDWTGTYLKVRFQGNALSFKVSDTKKNYYNVSGYNGGLRTRSSGVMLNEFPVEMIERAVWGMLPKGRLGRKIASKLHVYSGAEHEQAAQKPVVLDLSK